MSDSITSEVLVVDKQPGVSKRTFLILIVAIVFGVVGAAYQHALSVGFLSDDHLLLAFAQIAPIDGSVFAVNPIRWLLFHRPLVLFLWQLMYVAWGTNPFPFHLLSLILHAINSLLLIQLLLRLNIGSYWSAIFAGFVFALLPLNVETVTWLACWFDLLSLCLYLGTLICLVRWWQDRRIAWLLLSIGLYQLAIWSKESAFTLPIIALMLGRLLRPRQSFKLTTLEIIPYFILLLINIAQRYAVWGSIGGYDTSLKASPDLFYKALGAFNVLLDPINHLIFPQSVAYIGGAVSATTIIIGLLARTHLKLMVTGLLWIGVTLLPVLSLLPVGTDLQNARLLYPVAAGYSIVMGAALGALLQLARVPHRRYLGTVFVAVIVISGVTLVRIQTRPWVVATKATEMITQQVERALPPARLGTILQIVDIPDNYQGAYIYRLGFDMALLTRDQQLYIQWPEHSPQPIPYKALNLKGDFFQARVKADEQRLQWDIVDVRGVTTDQPLDPFPKTHWIYGMQADRLITELAQSTPTPRPVVQQWNPQDCQAVKSWKSIDLALDCQAGSGLAITPTGSGSVLSMPGVQIKTDRWTEVVVKMETLAPTQQAVVKLFWGPRTEDLLNGGSLAIEVPDDPRRQNYHFFIPPSRDGRGLKTLQLSPLNQAVPVRLLSIQVLQDP